MLHCSTNKHFCLSCLLLPSFLRNSVSINFYLHRFIKLQFNGTNMFPLIYIQSSGLLWPASCLCSLVIGCLNPVKVSGLHPKVWAGWCHESGLIGCSLLLIPSLTSPYDQVWLGAAPQPRDGRPGGLLRLRERGDQDQCGQRWAEER